jgi:hypothetical protein
MEIAPKPRIVNVDAMDEGIIIAFADGKSAFYSASLFHDLFSQAEAVIDLPSEEPENQPEELLKIGLRIGAFAGDAMLRVLCGSYSTSEPRTA